MSAQDDITKPRIAADGSFARPESSFRNFIEKGGRFEPEKGRYHLYIALVCPWATRTLIVRKLKGLEDFISVSVASPRKDDDGWPFATVDGDFPGTEADPLYNYGHTKDLYIRADPNFSGRYTVPILWDKKLHTIVNNESSEIIRIFNSAFNDLLPSEYAKVDLYPEHLRKEIDEINDWVYTDINNGVYRSGFATTQQAYEDAVKSVFSGLDKVEKILQGDKKFLVGNQLTEADVRLWVTTIRFDVAYHGIFKCNIKNIRHGYPAINGWMKTLYWNYDPFKSSTDFYHIKAGYYSTATWINPTKIYPVGPIPDIEPL
ncbi:S-glutathionyl-(chloro)hydroquinone reductase [Stygiomarasmius scandens]|uniref:S-glutathionyl-(Chloro)hydroquinone reductase n=1 Tax=Marasmiellus scandens TaxID=2682957 RepID=A0ABR1IM26_9AGAR